MPTASSIEPSPPLAEPSSLPSWVWLTPAALIAAWWVHELSFLWASMVEYRFGWIVVLLTAYLAWERWPTRPASDSPSPAWIPITLSLVALPLILLAELYKNGVARVPWTGLVLSFGCALAVTANILALHGRKTLQHFLFPLLFFFVAVPMPHFLWDPIVFGLRALVTALNVEALNIMGIPAEQQGHLIRLPRCVVGVDEACSGVRSLQSSIMAALFIGDLMLKRTHWKVIFFFAGIFLAVVGNFGRSLYLSITAHSQGPDALRSVHDTAGWSVLVFTAFGVGALAWFVERLERRANSVASSSSSSSSAPSI